MSKQSIQNKFQMGNEVYTLVYFPDKDDVTQVEPNYGLMEPVGGGVDEVFFKDGKGGHIKKFMSWIKAAVPANKNSMTPQKNFLLFALLDLPTNPQSLALNSMMCYAVQDISNHGDNPLQKFVNHLFGIKEEAPTTEKIHNREWASDFAIKSVEEPLAEEVIPNADTSTTKEAE